MKETVEKYVSSLKQRIKSLYLLSHKLPIVVFYKYMWENNKILLIKTLFFNYVFQFILEMLPWWFSRRKVGNKLRTARIKLNHNMVIGKDFKLKLMKDFVIKTVLFATLDSLNRYIKKRISLENKYEVRRLVLEKILYAEISELDKIKVSNLDERVSSDISSTLNFINKYLPSLVSGIYAFIIEGSFLLLRRNAIDPLALGYPIFIHALQKGIRWAHYRWFSRAIKKRSRDNNDKLDVSMANCIGGIIDIQTNNLQVQQLKSFDSITREEVRNKEGLKNYIIKAFSTLNEMSAFAYIIEIWCVHKIMKRQNLDHKKYSKIQQEIDHVVTLGRRTFNLLRKTKHIVQYQSKVVKLLDISNFMNESKILPKFDPREFKRLVVRDVSFSYKETIDELNPPVLNIMGELEFLPNKLYAIIGQNTAGKSTLTKLITKLYSPNSGEILLNDISYCNIPRVELREMISYIPQRPIIVSGTIRDNILIGNPYATEEQLHFAVEASGISDFMGIFSSTPVSNRKMASTLPSKFKKKKKFNSDSDDDSIKIPRTVSMAEMEEIVQPHGDFYDSSFSTTKYPVSIFHNDGESNSDVSSESSESESIGSEFESDSDSEEIEQNEEKDRKSIPPSMSVANMEDLMSSHSINGKGYIPRSSSSGNLMGLGRKKMFNSKEEIKREQEMILNQQVSSGGADVSGGFAQSIALARVFVRTTSKIIILDEATSQMDPLKLRTIVLPRLFEFCKKSNKCLIVITHSFYGMKEFDKIIVMHEGTVVDQGTHVQLVKNNSALYLNFLGLLG